MVPAASFNAIPPEDRTTCVCIDDEPSCNEPISLLNEPLISSLEPLINEPKSLSKLLILIVPVTSRTPVALLNFICDAAEFPSKILPEPSTKNPLPDVALVGGVVPNAILPLPPAAESISRLFVSSLNA